MLSFELISGGKVVPREIALGEINFNEVGLFETMRVYDGCLFQEDEHLDRLIESAKTSGYPYKINREKVRREVHAAIKCFAKENATVRLLLINGRSWVMMGERKHDASIFKQGVRLRTSPVRRTLTRSMPAEVKTSAYQNSLLAALEPRAKEIYEWVMLDNRGFVTEVLIGNLFIVTEELRQGNKRPLLKTPPVDGILNGVTRRFVIECALLENIAVSEDYLTRHEVYNAQEAFLSNTSWELLPIQELDARKIGTRLPGPITERLRAQFKKRVAKECQRIKSSVH